MKKKPSPQKPLLNSLDNARAVLVAVVDAEPQRRNPRNPANPRKPLNYGSVDRGEILCAMFGLVGLPVPRPGMPQFAEVWAHVDDDHPYRFAITPDVVIWLNRVQKVFHQPDSFEFPDGPRVTWAEGLRRCRVRLML